MFEQLHLCQISENDNLSQNASDVPIISPSGSSHTSRSVCLAIGVLVVVRTLVCLRRGGEIITGDSICDDVVLAGVEPFEFVVGGREDAVGGFELTVGTIGQDEVGEFTLAVGMLELVEVERVDPG